MNILKPRAYEIFEMVKMEIEKEGLQNSINAGVVISGGTALLDGILEVADGIMPQRPAGVDAHVIRWNGRVGGRGRRGDRRRR